MITEFVKIHQTAAKTNTESCGICRTSITQFQAETAEQATFWDQFSSKVECTCCKKIFHAKCLKVFFPHFTSNTTTSCPLCPSALPNNNSLQTPSFKIEDFTNTPSSDLFNYDTFLNTTVVEDSKPKATNYVSSPSLQLDTSMDSAAFIELLQNPQAFSQKHQAQDDKQAKLEAKLEAAEAAASKSFGLKLYTETGKKLPQTEQNEVEGMYKYFDKRIHSGENAEFIQMYEQFYAEQALSESMTAQPTPPSLSVKSADHKLLEDKYYTSFSQLLQMLNSHGKTTAEETEEPSAKRARTTYEQTNAPAVKIQSASSVTPVAAPTTKPSSDSIDSLKLLLTQLQAKQADQYSSYFQPQQTEVEQPAQAVAPVFTTTSSPVSVSGDSPTSSTSSSSNGIEDTKFECMLS